MALSSREVCLSITRGIQGILGAAALAETWGLSMNMALSRNEKWCIHIPQETWYTYGPKYQL